VQFCVILFESCINQNKFVAVQVLALLALVVREGGEAERVRRWASNAVKAVLPVLRAHHLRLETWPALHSLLQLLRAVDVTEHLDVLLPLLFAEPPVSFLVYYLLAFVDIPYNLGTHSSACRKHARFQPHASTGMFLGSIHIENERDQKHFVVILF
jgi:hypothetical protein